MSSQNNHAPDLNAILKTLSAFSNQANTHSPQTPSNNYDANDHEGEYEPPDAHSQSVTQSQIQSQTLRHAPPSSLSHRDSPQQPQLKDKYTSSTITTWPAALKQVMRTVGQNEEMQRRIRFLIQRQHDHEKQWWKGREALVQKQTSRKEKKRELDQVLYVL
ncbi:hypothetical protein ASPVEDRAFT_44882 [Aspergillus versicolor CBS 583.65]|uniref:Uncharacterized protein n=1 Tax=Aspergillus versicolor CBS 583.65 TaxID=1036611 RepID=A0A1L9PVC5_ASPVE|nr:uncharacterized protein ASPVEDRAFT_44882 [Aspergillus versicolor CBS 583.65]OJJ05392.1 hypothetical protein ASPVEDRAFT_44882 [Aspergillus versicolor CBS 583.65]